MKSHYASSFRYSDITGKVILNYMFDFKNEEYYSSSKSIGRSAEDMKDNILKSINLFRDNFVNRGNNTLLEGKIFYYGSCNTKRFIDNFNFKYEDDYIDIMFGNNNDKFTWSVYADKCIGSKISYHILKCGEVTILKLSRFAISK